MATFDDRDPQLVSGGDRPRLTHPQAITLGGEAMQAAASKYNAERADAIRRRTLELLGEGASLNTDTLQKIEADTEAPGAEIWTALQPLIDARTITFGSRGWHLAQVEVKQ